MSGHRARNIFTVTVSMIVVAGAVLWFFPIHVYDGFDGSSLCWGRWSSARMASRAAIMESAVVRSGRRALALTVHPGDRFEAASAGDAATERAELLEAWWLYSHTGRAYAYSFSLYLPESIPVSSERLVIAQWRQLCEASHCKPDRPILAIRYVNSRIVITRNDEHGQEILYQGDKNVQGQWLDFRVVTNFDATAKGLIVMSLNGKNIVQYHGPTVFASTHGYPAHGFVYFKTGLYRDVLNRPPWTIYIDEYRKDQCASLGCN